MKTLPYLIAGTFAGLVMSAGMAQAETPSSKVSMMASGLVALGAESASTHTTGWQTLMQSSVKVPEGKELAFDVSLQAALLTFTESTAKGGGNKSTVTADGRIQVRVKATGPTGVLYAEPCNDTLRFSYTELGGTYFPGTGENPYDCNGEPNGVAFASRFQKLDVSYENLVCLEPDAIFDPLNIDQDSCEITIGLLIGSLNSHSFNFVLPNLTSGVYDIEVQAMATANNSIFGDAKAEALVGLGSTHIETVRAVQGAGVSYDLN